MSNHRSEIKALVKKLSEEGNSIVEYQHGYRINNAIDIFKVQLTIGDFINKKWYKMGTIEDAEKALRDFITNPPQRLFKKTDTGRMTYKEFKYLMNKNQSNL